jgi:hypothetical protein
MSRHGVEEGGVGRQRAPSRRVVALLVAGALGVGFTARTALRYRRDAELGLAAVAESAWQRECHSSWESKVDMMRRRLRHGSVSRSAVVTTLAQEAKLPVAAAEPLLTALQLLDRRHSRPPSEGMHPDELRQAEQALRQAFAAAPNAEAVHRVLAYHLGGRTEWAPAMPLRLATWLPPETDRATLALTFGRWCLADPTWEIHRLALAGRPDDPVLLHSLAEVAAHSASQREYDGASDRERNAFALSLALREAALEGALARGARIDARLAAVLAARWIESLLDVGLSRTAVAAFARLPDDVRTILAAGTVAEKVAGTIDGLPLEGQLRDLRLDLGAAYALEERWADARAILANVAPKDRKPPRAPSEGEGIDYAQYELVNRRAAQWRVLEQVSSVATPDPYIAIEETLASEADVLARHTWHRILANYARRYGYHEAARYMMETALWYFEDARPLDPRLLRFVDDRVGRRAQALSVEIARERAATETLARDPAPAAGVGDPSGAAVQAVIEARRKPPFKTDCLPPSIRPRAASPEETQRHIERVASAFRWPEGFRVLRYEQQHNDVVGLATGGDLDPTGETAIDGYWILRSADGGKSWETPLFTGLRSHDPYVARPLSDLPLVQGGNLTVEADIDTIDPRSITFPPLFLRSQRHETEHVLTIPFAALRRDSDRDGLTDLAELGLFTDGADADTDDDGLPDGDDPLPQVPSRVASSSREAKALEAIIERSIIGAPRSLKERLSLWLRSRTPQSADVRIPAARFLVAGRSQLRGVRVSRRVVVLEPDELAQVQRTLPMFYPYEIRLLLLDHAKTRGLAIWSEQWRGGTERLRWRFGRWRVKNVSGWIT